MSLPRIARDPATDGPADGRELQAELLDARRKRAREAAERRDAESTRQREAEARRKLEDLYRRLGEVPVEEAAPDPRKVAMAQLAASVGFTVAGAVSAHTLLQFDSILAAFALFCLATGLLFALLGAAWNTHLSRRTYWRRLAWGWALVWLVAFVASSGLRGFLELYQFGAGPMLLASFLAAAVAVAAAVGAAPHVDAEARRVSQNAARRREREGLGRQIASRGGAQPSAVATIRATSPGASLEP